MREKIRDIREYLNKCTKPKYLKKNHVITSIMDNGEQRRRVYFCFE